jgi:hypothetical protein
MSVGESGPFVAKCRCGAQLSTSGPLCEGCLNKIAIQTREDLATGEAFVTTLNDVRMVRDRAVAAERERCAKICDEMVTSCQYDNHGGRACFGVDAARILASKIRGRE